MDIKELDAEAIGAYVNWLGADGTWAMQRQGPLRHALVCMVHGKNIALIGETALTEHMSPIGGNVSVQVNEFLFVKYLDSMGISMGEEAFIEFANFCGGLSSRTEGLFANDFTAPVAFQPNNGAEHVVDPVLYEAWRASLPDADEKVKYAIFFTVNGIAHSDIFEIRAIETVEDLNRLPEIVAKCYAPRHGSPVIITGVGRL